MLQKTIKNFKNLMANQTKYWSCSSSASELLTYLHKTELYPYQRKISKTSEWLHEHSFTHKTPYSEVQRIHIKTHITFWLYLDFEVSRLYILFYISLTSSMVGQSSKKITVTLFGVCFSLLFCCLGFFVCLGFLFVWWFSVCLFGFGWLVLVWFVFF